LGLFGVEVEAGGGRFCFFMKEITVGILALQGAFAEHLPILRALPNVRPVLVRTPAELANVDGLILPGGESTACALIAQRSGLWPHLLEFCQRKPVWGICAGLILLSQHVTHAKQNGQNVLGILPVRVVRNHFGAQTESFMSTLVCTNESGDQHAFMGMFIRAPIIELLPDQDVQVLVTLEQLVVAVRQGHVLGCAFHPELTRDPWWHAYFCHMVRMHPINTIT
jgi:5'-phosphate synthase pdxT subunit